jgi:cell division protein FtsQ
MSPTTRRRRSARAEGQVQRALRRSRWRVATSWLAPRWLSILAGAALFASTILLLTSPQFRVEQVVVRRDSASAQAAVTKATQMSQVVGRNIFLINTTRVAQEVAAIPSVLQARVLPRLPNVVEIEIVERVPIATWRAHNGTFLVDDQGYVVAEAPPESGAAPAPDQQALLAVNDTTGRDVAVGDQVDQRALLAARELTKALPAAGASVREVEFSSQGLVLVTDRQWRVIFGDTESLNSKLASFKAIVDLARSQNVNIRLVDLRPKDRPFYQLAGAPGAAPGAGSGAS